MALEDSIEVLAKHAAHHPEKVGVYARFLVVVGEAARTATPEQRYLMRALQHGDYTPEELTVEIEKIMGWDAA